MAEPNPAGKVALLLCEALLHVLVEERVISQEAALSAIESVLEVTQESSEAGTMDGNSVLAVALVERIAATFAARD